MAAALSSNDSCAQEQIVSDVIKCGDIQFSQLVSNVFDDGKGCNVSSWLEQMISSVAGADCGGNCGPTPARISSDCMWLSFSNSFCFRKFDQLAPKKQVFDFNCDICIINTCKEEQEAHDAVEDIVEDEEDVHHEYHKDEDVRAEEADNNQDKNDEGWKRHSS